MTRSSSLVTARLRRRVPVFVCRKCEKRAPDGGDIRKALKRALKSKGRDGGFKPRMIATSCFGLCPKRAVVVASAVTLDRGEVLVIGDAGQAEAAGAALLPSPVSD